VHFVSWKYEGRSSWNLFGDGKFNGGSWMTNFVEKWLTQMYKKVSSMQAKHLFVSFYSSFELFEIVVESWTFEVRHLFCVMFDVKLVVAWEKCM
jgi:hypothetical protein